MARKKTVTTTTTRTVEVTEDQVTIDDFDLGVEHLAGAVPAGAEEAERARDLFYRALVGDPGWKAQLRAEFENVLGAILSSTAWDDERVYDDLIGAVESTLMAAQYADAVRNGKRDGT
jgi:hypothetical protein